MLVATAQPRFERVQEARAQSRSPAAVASAGWPLSRWARQVGARTAGLPGGQQVPRMVLPAWQACWPVAHLHLPEWSLKVEFG